jgi:hypothetical protein
MQMKHTQSYYLLITWIKRFNVNEVKYRKSVNCGTFTDSVRDSMKIFVKSVGGVSYFKSTPVKKACRGGTWTGNNV